jgi:hypothetical protein
MHLLMFVYHSKVSASIAVETKITASNLELISASVCILFLSSISKPKRQNTFWPVPIGHVLLMIDNLEKRKRVAFDPLFFSIGHCSTMQMLTMAQRTKREARVVLQRVLPLMLTVLAGWVVYKLIEIAYLALSIKLFDWESLSLSSLDNAHEEYEDRLHQRKHTRIPPRVIQLVTGPFANSSSLPTRWQAARKACAAVLRGTGISMELWTEQDCFHLLSLHYPNWLRFVRSIKRDVERADACRYFVLFHIRGIYIDCDLHCLRSLQPLLTLPGAALGKTNIGLSNDFIAAPPGHRLLELTAFSLRSYSDTKLLPVRHDSALHLKQSCSIRNPAKCILAPF